MLLLIILIITEILTFTVIRQHFFDSSWMRYYFLVTLNTLISIGLWLFWFKLITFRGIFDEPIHIWIMMGLTGSVCGVVVPRIVLIIFHFTGVFTGRKKPGRGRFLTNIGLVISGIIFVIVVFSILFGTFNIKTERISLKVRDLKPELNNLKIVMISDLHLASFYHHKDDLIGVLDKINRENPDLILNTGDYISYGWREFGRFDTILSKIRSKYGNYSVLGNHDFGTYHPYFTEADKKNNVMIMNNLITASGFKVLNDESVMIKIGDTRVSISGVMTMGSFPKIIHGDLKKAVSGTDSADFKILLAHDPNQWEKEVTGKTDIDITFSGHTHGMQAGIYTRNFRWSPAGLFYPEWNGAYRAGDQYLVVSKGIGVLGIPFRIWMPPDVTIVTTSPD